MPTDEHIQRFEKLLEHASAGDLESVREGIARVFFAYSPGPDEPTGREVFFDTLTALRGAMSDLSITAENLRVDGELIKGRVTAKGTHDGKIWNVPPSGDAIAWSVNIAAKVLNDGFAIALEDLAVPDIIGALRKMRLINPPDQMDQPAKYPFVIPEVILQLVFNGQAAEKPCSHLSLIKVTEPTTDVCEQCVAADDIWPALRMCLVCGFVGCCDTSKNKHAKQHYQETGHPLFRSIRMQESWSWCYDDNALIPTRRLNQFRAEAVPDARPN